MRNTSLALAIALVLAACSAKQEEQAASQASASAAAPSVEASSDAAPAVAGFDPAKAPLAAEPGGLGAFPYFGLIDGYTAMTKENFQGDSRMEDVRDSKFDRFEFFDGVKMIPVEGQLSTRYARGAGSSWFEMMSTYKKFITDLGGVTVWEGSGKDVADKKLSFADKRHRGRHNLADEKGAVYMVRTPSREIWIEVWQPWDNPNYFVTVVEKQSMAMRAGFLPAEAMKAALDKDGRVAIPVLFDTDKTTLKPESDPVLAEVVKLMTANPGLSVAVEGHTDDQGTPQHNLTLSDGRAKAVVAALTAKGVAAARLSPKGFGQTRPVADNASEDGRAKNRRVELVKK